MVELGIDINAKGDMGNTALHYAKTFGHDEIYDYLISAGARTDIVNEFGKLTSENKRYK